MCARKKEINPKTIDSTESPVAGELISVVIAFYNEELTILPLFEQLNDIFKGLARSVEYWFVDDGSSDGTRAVLEDLARRESSNVNVIVFSRNFGHHVALFAGLEHSQGDTCIMMDGDLQDNPRDIPRLLETLELGHDLVLVVRSMRQESWQRQMAATLFWKASRWATGLPIVENQSVFRAFRRNVRDAVVSLPETQKFLAGIFAWVGFRMTTIELPQGKRFAGTTKYCWKKLIDQTLTAILGFSPKPLRSLTWGGLASLIIAVLLLLISIGAAADLYALSPSLSFLAAVIFAGSGLQLIGLGIVGEYLARVFENSLHRPAYIIDKLHRAEKSGD